MAGRAGGSLRTGLGTALGMAIAIGMLVAGCAGSALGDDQPPASLDPRSPRLSAVNVAFDRSELLVPAGVPFVLVFENREAVSHNVSVYADAALQDRVFEGVLFGGPATHWYPIPSLAPGSYLFQCDLHPNMAGRLIAS